MKCPRCGGEAHRPKTRALQEAKEIGGMVFRHKECPTCSLTFATAEMTLDEMNSLLIEGRLETSSSLPKPSEPEEQEK